MPSNAADVQCFSVFYIVLLRFQIIFTPIKKKRIWNLMNSTIIKFKGSRYVSKTTCLTELVIWGFPKKVIDLLAGKRYDSERLLNLGFVTSFVEIYSMVLCPTGDYFAQENFDCSIGDIFIKKTSSHPICQVWEKNQDISCFYCQWLLMFLILNIIHLFLLMSYFWYW